ncbi:MAG: HRDC domain-containing protein [Desulfobacterales bacterium]|nr:HRDC domain-containing protein [Desulfobacterales bacterium]
MNRFLRSARVLTVHREFVDQGDNSFWCLAVEYLGGSPEQESGKGVKKRNQIDYKEVLSPEDFALFVRLREWRKGMAANEAVPVYTIFNNEQLAAISEKKIATLADLQKLEGVGEARVRKYGEAVVKIVKQASGSDDGGSE